MRNVLLISPPSRVINHYRPPLALMYLSGYLKKNGIVSKIIDITLKDQIRDRAFYARKDDFLKSVADEIIRQVEACDADVVGLTCYTPELQEVEYLVSRIKAVKPGAVIVVGGIHPTLYPQDFLGPVSPFDFVVIGEGEVTFLELVKAIRAGKKEFRDVRGIGYFDKSSLSTVITQPRPLVTNLDEIAFPDYDDLDMEFYTNASPYSIRGVFVRSFYISSSRGCPSSCVFCVSKKLREYHGINRYVRLRSAASLYAEIQHLRQAHNIDSFYFIDDLFTLKKENVYAFCDLMVKNKSRLIWGCSSKVNTVDFDVLRAMRNAGCVQIDFGVEKGSDAALEKLKKGINVAQIKKTFAHCHKLGIRVFANMLVNTPQESEADLEDIVKLVEDIRPHILSVNIFTPYPGCEIFDQLCGGIERQEYPLLMQDPNILIEKFPKKFRFAAHALNLQEWVARISKKYNMILPNISFFMNCRYLRCLFFSRRKDNYIKQLGLLINEFVIQKFKRS